MLSTLQQSVLAALTARGIAYAAAYAAAVESPKGVGLDEALRRCWPAAFQVRHVLQSSVRGEAEIMRASVGKGPATESVTTAPQIPQKQYCAPL
jgi:hypothetical protein